MHFFKALTGGGMPDVIVVWVEYYDQATLFARVGRVIWRSDDHLFINHVYLEGLLFAFANVTVCSEARFIRMPLTLDID